jgi:hypothetical protein
LIEKPVRSETLWALLASERERTPERLLS